MNALHSRLVRLGLVKNLLALSAIVAALGTWSCEKECTLSLDYALVIDVTDATTGAALCGAVVVVRDGDFVEELDHGDTCETAPSGTFLAAMERPGTYDVSVTHPNYETREVKDVVVTEEKCLVDTQHVDVQLQPLP